MRNWAIHRALSQQRQIRLWKKRHLYKNSPEAVTSPTRGPVFMATANKQQRAEELNDFLDRLRDRN